MSQNKLIAVVALCSLVLLVGILSEERAEKEQIGSQEVSLNHDLPEKVTYSGPTMGTSFSVVYINTSGKEDAVVNAQVLASIELVNTQMSTYKQDSNLSEFNRLPENSCYQFPEDTYKVISMAQEISKTTDGAFDVTIGPLVNMWGFGPNYKPEVIPDDREIAKIKSTKVGYQSLELKGNNTVCKEKPVYVDLSAIAKGYAVDLAAKTLDNMGIDSYLVEIGGELKARGVKPNNQLWRVAVEEPSGGLGHSVHKVVELKDAAIATSGDYRNYYEVDGQRYSHTIDPVTGKPIKHSLASISVLHSSVAYADAIATGLNVMGPEKALALAKSEGLAIYMIVKKEQDFSVESTEQFNQYLLD
ncbi:FAD:protein FMN transferase [Litoribacillus peritrichatus]|uniref:FAD:protein FMN transferase n=1 Tax=Litoribacillus peritrichatus TaxID=718191 RepID=A0ABP7MDC6_9GAMM